MLKEFNKKINKNFRYNFSILESGLYIIEISASCKSWWQNFIRLRSFFRDDDLAVKIDDRSFPKLDGRRGLFDGEAAWNGNNLKGLSKIDRFYIYLKRGEHELLFLADQKPTLESVNIYRDVRLTSNVKHRAEEGDRRQWLTIILVDLSLKSLKITAKARQGKSLSLFGRDDSDLKLIIDGEIQKNNEPKSHPYWYWCGRTLKGKGKAFSKELNLSKKLHYIEIWADRMPEIEGIILGFPDSKIEFDISDIQPYAYKGISGDEEYDRFDAEIRDAVNFWNREFFSQKYPPLEVLHPNLAKAMIYIESRMGYHKVLEGSYPAYPDVMQVANTVNPAMGSMREEPGYLANEFISEEEYGHMNYSYPKDKDFPNGDTPKDSIFWGVRWLYHKAQYLPQISEKPYSREWRSWNKAVQNYNSEGNTEYEKEVYDVYERGIDKRSKKNTTKLWAIVFAVTLGVSWMGVALGLKLYDNRGRAWLTFEDSEEKEVLYTLQANIFDGIKIKKTEISRSYKDKWGFFEIPKEGNPGLHPQELFGDEDYEIVITGWGRVGNTIRYILKKTKNGLAIIPNRGEYGDLSPAFRGDQIDFIDLDKDGILEVRESVFIPYSNALDQIWHSWFRYNKEKNIYEFIKKDKEVSDI